MPRSNASGQKTVWLKDGEIRTIPFSVTGSTRYTVSVRYSNDNFGSLEVVTVSINGKEIGSFSAQDTGNFGFGWNVFTSSESLGPVDLLPGAHSIKVSVEGGDGYGVEIDLVFLDVVQCFYPSVTVTKNVVPVH